MLIMCVWTNEFMYLEAKKEGGAILKAGAIIGMNMVFSSQISIDWKILPDKYYGMPWRK